MSVEQSPRPTSLVGGLVLVSLAGIVWGTIGPGADVLNDRSGLAPLTVTAYRAAAAVLVLGGVVLVSGRLRAVRSAVRGHWGRVLLVGLLTAAFQMLFFLAVLFTGVSISTVVCLGFAPALLLVLGSVNERRWPDRSQVFTVLVAVTGLLLVSVDRGGADASRPALGLVCALGSGAAYAVSAEIAAPLSKRLDTLTITAATIGIAALFLIPVGLLVTAVRGDAFTSSDAVSWLVIVYLGVVTLAIAYALLFTGLRSTPSGAAVIATLLEPVTAVLIAVAFLGEHLTLGGMLGCLFIVGAIASLGRSAEPSPPQ